MSVEFAGLFEVLASDQHDARLASRKALVLSRDRIDIRLGKFLAASQSLPEFDARYDLVADDFAGIIRVAANEVGHGDPDSLIVTLHDHYRAAGKPPWLKDDDDDSDDKSKKDDDDSDDDKKAPPFGKKDSATDEDEDDEGTLEEDQAHRENDDPSQAERNDRDNQRDRERDKESKTADAVPLVQAALIEPASGSGEDNLTAHEHQLIQEGKAKIGSDGILKLINPDMHTPPSKQASVVEAEARIIEALTRKDYNLLAGAIKSAPIDNHEEVAGHFADHLADANERFDRERFVKASTPESTTTESSVHTADEGNTGLSGPSPKMDKKRWTPKSVKPIDVPSERHPTIQKDVTEVMPKDNLTEPAHDMDEINALTTVEELPSGTGLDDAGFAGNNQDMAPHTKTFGDGGQTDPVKSESLEA
jgi:hypothetical protein